jgi:DNA polymerase-3 subunit delta
MSLCAERRLIELRIPGGKPGSDGADAIVRYCEHLAAENVTLVCLPRLSKSDQSSGWFEALSSQAVVVNVFPIERARLSEWIAARLAAQGQRAGSEALEFLAAAVEGNLLAAHQEIQKLALVHPPGELSYDSVRQAVLDVSRYDVYQVSEAMLAGEHGRALRVLESLRGEGEPPVRILWVLGEELRALAGVAEGLNAGRPAPVVLREYRVFGEPRQTHMTRAARGVSPATLAEAVGRLARCERIAKGVDEGDVWDEIADLTMML